MLIEKRAPPPETGVGGARLRRAYALLSHPDHPNLKLLGFRVLFQNYARVWHLLYLLAPFRVGRELGRLRPGPAVYARQGRHVLDPLAFVQPTEQPS